MQSVSTKVEISGFTLVNSRLIYCFSAIFLNLTNRYCIYKCREKIIIALIVANFMQYSFYQNSLLVFLNVKFLRMSNYFVFVFLRGPFISLRVALHEKQLKIIIIYLILCFSAALQLIFCLK